MKHTTKLFLSGLLLSAFTVGANAGTLTPSSENSRVTLNGNPVTQTTETKKGDLIKVHAGSGKLVQKGCDVTINANQSLKVSEADSCSGVAALDNVQLIDPATAGKACLECKVSLANRAAGLGGLSTTTLVVGGLVVAGVIAAAVSSDNGSVSP